MDALIGFTGFVGSNLVVAHNFTALYNSDNINEAKDASFELLVCAGPGTEKWIANKDEAADKANIDALMKVLASVSVEQAVLISTADVYADTQGRTETDDIDLEDNSPFGRNRALFEIAFRAAFPGALIVRLPDLFGPGLKANVLHDLIVGHELEKINTDGIHQFYELRWLWKDLERALEEGIQTLNISTPPVRIEELCRQVFDVEYVNRLPSPVEHDIQTVHAAEWGESGSYLYPLDTVLTAMRHFVGSHPDLKPLPFPPVQ